MVSKASARFAASARAGDDGQFPERQIEIDALEIVLTRAANLNATVLRRCGQAVFLGFRRNHRRLSGMPNRYANDPRYFANFSPSFVCCAINSRGMSFPSVLKNSLCASSSFFHSSGLSEKSSRMVSRETS